MTLTASKEKQGYLPVDGKPYLIKKKESSVYEGHRYYETYQQASAPTKLPFLLSYESTLQMGAWISNRHVKI